MKTIAKRFWNEPSVAIGALVSLGVLILTIVTNEFNASSIVGIIAPFASSLGIRQLVTPTGKETQTK